MTQKNRIMMLCAVLALGGTALTAQTPFLNFDQTAGNWAIAVDAPDQNVFSLADTTDAYQGAGSLVATAKFTSFPRENQAIGSAFTMFQTLVNLSGADEVRFRIKILSPSTVNRSMQWYFNIFDRPAGAADRESWYWGPDYDIPYVPADSAWHQIILPFSRLIPPSAANAVNGVFDKEAVDGIAFGLRADGSAPDSIKFLIDDLTATKTVKEFQLVSFDEVDPSNGWESNPGDNAWELSINTTDKFEGEGSLDVMMNITKFEDWGAEAEVGWYFDTARIDLTGIEELRFRIHVMVPPTFVHATRFYFWFMDQPEGEPNGEVWTTNPTYSVMTSEDKNGFWNEVAVPMDQFVFASWNADNGTVNNGVFDKDAVISVNLNVGADNPPGEPDAVEFLIDDLWATTGGQAGVGVSDKNAPHAPADFLLGQNYPNPFNPTTAIRYQILQPGSVHLKVFDCRGQLVQTVIDGEFKQRGDYSLSVDLSRQSSGIYFYALEQGGRTLIRKMTLLK